MRGRENVRTHPALTDESSGLPNQLHFELVYGYLFEAADRGTPLAVLLLGVPEQAPERLRGFGERLATLTRGSDLPARLDDGRFAVLLQGTNLAGARVAADRLADALAGAFDGPLSVALAAYHTDMNDPADLLEAAEAALARAEASGGGLEMA